MAGFDPWPYAVPVLVLLKTLAGAEVPKALGGRAEFADLMLPAVMRGVAARGEGRVYGDGGRLVQAFLREGLIADRGITRVSVRIGAGRRLFGAVTGDVGLVHEGTRSFAFGLVKLRYRVARYRVAGHKETSRRLPDGTLGCEWSRVASSVTFGWVGRTRTCLTVIP